MPKRELMPNEIIEQKLIETVAATRKRWPCVSNRASELGHPCLRRLTYLRIIEPDQIPMHSTELQYIFNLGNALEPLAIQELRDAGYQVHTSPRGKSWRKYNITGSIDARMEWNNKVIPVEIKSVNHFLWMKLDKDPSIDTLKYHPRVWVQKYPAQLLIYLLLHEVDEGFFFFKDKLTNRPKIVWLYLEPYIEYAESLIRKAEKINEYVKAYDGAKTAKAKENTLPPHTENIEICEDCEFKTLCLPKMELGQALEILQDDDEFLDKMKRREELHEASKEYKKLDDEIKDRFKKLNKEKVAIGEYIVTLKKSMVKEYQNIPTGEMKERVTVKILKLGGE